MSKAKYDNHFKQRVLLQNIDKKVAEVRRLNINKTIRHHLIDRETGERLTYYDVNAFEAQAKKYRKGFNEIDCAIRLNDSKYRKAKKVRDKIEKLVESGNAIFVTLTFTDITLQNTTIETRRRYVSRYLKANAKNYVANIDFGAQNGREHYHAVVDKDINFNDWYKYGAIKVERVRSTTGDLFRVSKYVTKLTNHALKVEGLQPRLIYSRCIV